MRREAEMVTESGCLASFLRTGSVLKLGWAGKDCCSKNTIQNPINYISKQKKQCLGM